MALDNQYVFSSLGKTTSPLSVPQLFVVLCRAKASSSFSGLTFIGVILVQLMFQHSC